MTKKTIVSDKAILTSTDPCFRYYGKMSKKGQRNIQLLREKKLKSVTLLLLRSHL